jgi:nucleoside-diphosphate-sugar epimerase
MAKDKQARFVLASTSEVYGDPQVHPQPEDYWGHVNPVGPRGVYDEAKRYAEALTTAYRTAHDVDIAIVRIFNTYGDRVCRPPGGRPPGAPARHHAGQDGARLEPRVAWSTGLARTVAWFADATRQSA